MARLGQCRAAPDMLAVYLVSGALALLAAGYYFLTRNYSYWKKRGVFSPEPKFFFGHLKDSILRNRTIMHVTQDYYNAFPNEKVVGLLRIQNPCLLIRDLEIIKHILIKDFNVFVDRGLEFSREGLGLNLFHADGDTWRVLRAKLSPIFTSGKLKNMFHLIDERCEAYKIYLDKVLTAKPELDSHPLIQEFTMATIAACAFGVDLEFNESEMKTVLNRLDKLIFSTSYLTELDYMFPGILKKFNIDLLPNFVNTFFQGLVRDIDKGRNGTPSGRKDFMDLLFEMKQQGAVRGAKKCEDDAERVLELNDHILAAQAFAFFAGGYETSATTMTHLLHELAFHPDEQEKVHREITAVLAANGGKLTYDSIKQMTYLHQVFDETLRLYPIVDPLLRMSNVDYKIPGTDIVLEKDMPIFISVRGLHYDESIYPEPHKFDPSRFAPENEKSRHPCAYLPFGNGPRNCIGMRFARVQSAACLATMLPRWRVLPAQGSKHALDFDPHRFLLGPKGGVPLRFERRL